MKICTQKQTLLMDFEHENECVTSALDLLRRLLHLDPLLVLHQHSSVSKPFVDFYLKCLHGSASFALKRAALDLLQFFLFPQPAAILARPDQGKLQLPHEVTSTKHYALGCARQFPHCGWFHQSIGVMYESSRTSVGLSNTNIAHSHCASALGRWAVSTQR